MSSPEQKLSAVRVLDPDVASRLPRIVEEADPGRGRATLTWLRNPLQPRSSPLLRIHIRGEPWHHSGVRPYAWSYTPGLGPNGVPVIRVALRRLTWVEQTIRRDRAQEQRVKVGSGIDGILFDRNNPLIEILRPQIEALMPAPEEPVDVHSVIGEPMMHSSPILSRHVQLLYDYAIVPTDVGTRIVHRLGWFDIDIRIQDRAKRAAYAYDIVPVEQTGGISFFVNAIHTDNVRIRYVVHESVRDLVGVFSRETGMVRMVPQQGAEIPYQRSLMVGLRPDDIILSTRTTAAIFAFELAVSMIPFVGVLYDIGQLAYIAATGRTFWGQRVSEQELVVMGALIVLPIGAASTTKAVKALARAKALRRALDEKTLRSIREVADRGFVDAIGALSPKSHARLVRSLEDHFAGKLSFAQLMSTYDRVLGSAYLDALRARMLDKVFTRNFRGFRDPELAAAYERYLAQPKFRRNARAAADPASWAKKQNAATTATTRLRLQRLLGEKYVDVINDAIRGGKIPRSLTPTDIANYDKLVGLGVTNFADIQIAAKKIGGIGEHFEIDHLLEQRFWRNNPSVTSAFDEVSMSQAFLVPKNERVAGEMFRNFGGQRIHYVHTTKTVLLKELIPHGSEAFWTVQQIWDAHAHVFRQLRVDKSIVEAMKTDFRLLAQNLGQTLNTRLPAVSRMRHGSGWPRMYKNPDKPGEWILVR
ncbi:MAG: hypothetical protein KDC95_09370 [Planctomycetes bacterium]|nr:hypothetical protein [Planctomycetota bacterium]